MSTNSFSVTANPNDTIYLRDPSGSKIGEPVKALLDEAYKELGFKTKYINVASTSELAVASKGRISGALARQSGIESQYPDSIRVPTPLLQFELVQVGNRKLYGDCQTSRSSR